MTEDGRREVVITYLKQLRMTRMARDCESVAREAEQRGLGYLGYLQTLLEGELAQRHEQQLRQRLKAAAFPYQKRLEDFDFSLIPCVSKIRLLELAQGASPFRPRQCALSWPERNWEDTFAHGLGEGALFGWLSRPVSPSGHASHRTGSRSQGTEAPTVAGTVSPL